ncbi:hypothetical protein BCR36DRAFT_405219 [Piromyces finnis]|uniref:EGF-like domain-containing protein n=1 Tax=Piromyces finnis TaxID=1754191 RepID=A0A1Y1V5Q4_9FUNG|nr:hypothetical protein BCR36DRAFT_405219 [Piromyces finnis]|eukprot:ORX47898.1 hypothetical protein BCR36DRAFT_405219 [Piromyces finnis]
MFCFTDVNTLNININSSKFEYNHASNGGVMYFSKSENHFNNNSIKFYNSTFSNNGADYFGGVIYSSFEELNITNLENTFFKENNAYSGGVFYIDNDKNLDKILFNANSKDIKYLNNTAESYGNNYASDPYKIILLNENIKDINIKSGELLSLKFRVIDEYNQIVKDISKFFSDIILKIDGNIKDKKLIGNICYFSNGECELKEFKIYTSKPSSFKLMFSVINNDNNNIALDTTYIDTYIHDCNNEQIKMYTKDGFYYCENPVCNYDCPVSNGTAICIKGENNVNNKEFLNKCQCVPGWTGDKCEIKKFTEFNSINYIRIISLLIIILISMVMIYFAFNKSMGIIKDPGFLKCELALLGLLLYFVSNHFNIFSNYSDCSLYIFFKHSGILLLYSIFLLFIEIGCELGINMNELYLINILPINNNDTIGDSCTNISKSNFKEQKSRAASLNEIGFVENALSEQKLKKSSLSGSLNSKFCLSKASLFNKNDNIDNLKKLDRSISYVHSLVTEVATTYIVTLILILLVIIFYSTKNNSKSSINLNEELVDRNYEQEHNGSWRYKCDLNKMELILNLTEFLLLFFLITKIKKIWNSTYVFKCTKYISYCILIWIMLGPLFNLVSYIALFDQSIPYTFFNYVFNSICYVFIFIMLSWDKLYYIIKSDGNNVYNYFNSTQYEQCFVHKSFTCNCKKKTIDGEIETMKNYIEFYNYCSNIIVISDGHIHYINKKRKSTMKFIA